MCSTACRPNCKSVRATEIWEGNKNADRKSKLMVPKRSCGCASRVSTNNQIQNIKLNNVSVLRVWCAQDATRKYSTHTGGEGGHSAKVQFVASASQMG